MSSSLTVYAEQGLIASILLDPEALQDIADVVTPDDFLEPRHMMIFESILEMNRLGDTIRLSTLGVYLRNKGELLAVGGVEYLTSLIDPSQPFTMDADAQTYAEVVKDESVRRSLASIALAISDMSKLDSGNSTDDILAIAQGRVARLQERAVRGKTAMNLKELGDEMLIRLQERESGGDALQGLSSGLADLDAHTTGFFPGQLIVIAARPGIGKSTIGVDFMRAASIRGNCTSMIFSLEMTRQEIMDRILAAEANVKLNSIRSGRFEDGDWADIHAAMKNMAGSNLIIDDSPAITIDYIRAAATIQASKDEGLDLIVVDYLQLLSSSGRVESRQQEVSGFSRSLKLLAKTLGIPIIAIAQLNRGPENRTDKEPKLSDIRESGAIEQDADIVMFLHALSNEDGVAAANSPRVLILEKNRNGPAPMKVQITALLEYSKFVSGTGLYPVEPPDFDPNNEHPDTGDWYEGESPALPNAIAPPSVAFPPNASYDESAPPSPAWGE